MKLDTAKGLVAAAFTVEADDQIMLVTDGGKLIRTPVADIRIAGRSTRGVTLFRIAKDERVVSVAHLIDVGEEEGNGEDDAPVQDNGDGEDDAPAQANGDGEGKDHG